MEGRGEMDRCPTAADFGGWSSAGRKRCGGEANYREFE
jgi:hypothetical protein